MKVNRKQPSRNMKGRWKTVSGWGIGLFGFILIFGLNTKPVATTDSPPEWLRIFDVICVATRLNESVFHKQVKRFDGDAESLQKEDLHAISPHNIAGYLVTDSLGGTSAVLMGLVSADGIESRNCGVVFQATRIDEAVEIITKYFPMKTLNQFKQGTNQFVIFHGYLAGYSDMMAISVQSSEDMSVVSIFKLPNQ